MNRRFFLGLVLLGWAAGAEALEVEADFEGASVRVLERQVESQTIRFMPGGEAARGWPCWWSFRVSGLRPAEPLVLRLVPSDAVLPAEGAALQKPLAPGWAMPDRATYSRDGKVWQHTAPGEKKDGEMIYTIPPVLSEAGAGAGPGAGAVLVAWGPPYPPSRAVNYVAEAGKEQRLAQEMELCRSREGRSVPLLRVSEGDRVPERRFGIWVQARQHAWESGSSWVWEGFTDWIVSEEPEATWLRQHAEIYLVPIMDVDNTATGNGGKDALPHDHNRDWSEKPNWNEVAAAQRILRSLAAEGRLDVFLDLHNPAPGDKKAFYFAGPPELLQPAARAGREEFLKLSKEEITPVMPMLDAPRITGPGYHRLWRQISGQWVNANGNAHTLALCLETPWNTEHSTVAGYKGVGQGLARAVQRYLSTREPGAGGR
jgi:hypothetical protein